MDVASTLEGAATEIELVCIKLKITRIFFILEGLKISNIEFPGVYKE